MAISHAWFLIFTACLVNYAWSSAHGISTKQMQAYRENILRKHNEYRKRHGAPPLKYWDHLDKQAQNWADHLARTGTFDHRPNNQYGENLASSTGSVHQIGGSSNAVEMWYEEVNKYSFNRNVHQKGTGHFTAVVWRSTTHIGCGVARGRGGWWYVVCNYYPEGNVQGSYKTNVLPRGSNGCPAHFDKSLCWHNTPFGVTAERACPFTFCDSVPGCERIQTSFHAQRLCTINGNWSDPVYAQCLELLNDHKPCIVGYCHACPDVLRELVISVSLTLSVFSVLLLIAALVLFSAFESLQCRRLWIHKQLAAAFVFRFAVLATWNVVQAQNLFKDCSTYHPTPLWHLEWLCKMNLWIFIYFQVASIMWMLIEGAYLYSRFTVIGMRSDAPTKAYLFAGWGLPFLVVLSWTVVHQIQSAPGSFCWMPYAQGAHLWILSATMGTALILNLLFLLGIVFILIQKLRSDSTAESKKIWRTIKATLLLVPLLGVSNIPLFYEPAEQSGAYMLTSAILQHSQGIFIAVLYCFLNSEIQNAVKRRLAKGPCRFFRRIFSQPPNFETERTYVPPPEVNASRTRRCNNEHGVPMEEINGDHKKSPKKQSL